jgi:hypothetical protein
MLSLRATSSSLLFGFGILAIGLSIVRMSGHPWVVAILFGLIAGGLRQLIWFVLDHQILRWKWQDISIVALGGFLALTVFTFAGLTIPTKPIETSIMILVGIALAHFSFDKTTENTI